MRSVALLLVAGCSQAEVRAVAGADFHGFPIRSALWREIDGMGVVVLSAETWGCADLPDPSVGTTPDGGTYVGALFLPWGDPFPGDYYAGLAAGSAGTGRDFGRVFEAWSSTVSEGIDGYGEAWLDAVDADGARGWLRTALFEADIDATRCSGTTSTGSTGVGPCGGAGEVALYRDADGDGYGAGDPISGCTPPETGWAARGDDCDDGAPATHPDADEACNGTDDDCDGLIDEGC